MSDANSVQAGLATLGGSGWTASTTYTGSTGTAFSLPAGTTAASSLRVPHGVAPTAPVNGDIWTTTAGMFVRINGVTKTVTLT